MKLSNKTVTEMAAEMTILDAIEKGHSTFEELIAYMNSEVFKKAVESYKKIIKAYASSI